MSRCGICGTPARPPFRTPRAESAPDLDMRPGEPARSTLNAWCLGHGMRRLRRGGGRSVRPDRPDRAVVESDAYRMLRTLAPEESLPFRQWALICAYTADRLRQAEALLQAAWAADDVAAMSSAAELRSEVAALWDGTADVVLGLRRLDVLRRAGCSKPRRRGRRCWQNARAMRRRDRSYDFSVPGSSIATLGDIR